MHVEITKATKSFAARGRVVEALREVSLGVGRGEFVALVDEYDRRHPCELAGLRP